MVVAASVVVIISFGHGDGADHVALVVVGELRGEAVIGGSVGVIICFGHGADHVALVVVNVLRGGAVIGGSVGAMIHGLSNGEFLDDPRFDPIWERAQALDVPIYLHPAMPHPDVIKAYLGG